MSAIIQRTKKHYHKTLRIELILISAVSFLCFLAVEQVALSLLLGSLSAFLPYILFVYWVFFSPFATSKNKTGTLYRGEGIKWIATIILIMGVFTLYKEIKMWAFFSGYFVTLILNIVLPVTLKPILNKC